MKASSHSTSDSSASAETAVPLAATAASTALRTRDVQVAERAPGFVLDRNVDRERRHGQVGFPPPAEKSAPAIS